MNQNSFNATQSCEVPQQRQYEKGLNVQELKEFQVQCINAVQQGNDVILVQPTGSVKSLCFTFPALLNPGKVSIVIEPVVAIINNQVEALQKKGIDAVALGRAVGNKKSSNYQRVFQRSNVPNLAFCTPEYLFGMPTNATFSGSCGIHCWLYGIMFQW